MITCYAIETMYEMMITCYAIKKMYEWRNDLRFYIIFHGISVISGRGGSDNERPCAIEPRLLMERIPPPAGFEPGPLD